jgi:hypothetical protein
MSNIVSVKEADFLDEDPPLRAQNYVCLSFISPEDVIKEKSHYQFEKFIQNLSNDMNGFFKQLSEKYPDDIDGLKMIKERYNYVFNPESIKDEFDFFIVNNPQIDKEYYEKNNYQTNIRGIKVRGVFDTLREAEIRSQVLKKIDGKFNVYVAQVGVWCPWSPNPDDIQNQEYAESHLNTLMKNYKENLDKKDEFYEERKQELQTLKVKEKIEEIDPWLANKEAPAVPAPEDLPAPEDMLAPEDMPAVPAPEDVPAPAPEPEPAPEPAPETEPSPTDVPV